MAEVDSESSSSQDDEPEDTDSCSSSLFDIGKQLFVTVYTLISYLLQLLSTTFSPIGGGIYSYYTFMHSYTDTIEDMLCATGDDYYPFTSKFQALAFMLVNSPRPLVRYH